MSHLFVLVNKRPNWTKFCPQNRSDGGQPRPHIRDLGLWITVDITSIGLYSVKGEILGMAA
jgi:hypothetical protein